MYIGEDSGRNKGVDSKTFDELESFILSNSDHVEFLKLAQDKNGRYLQAQNYVGVIQTKSGVTVEILPKVTDIDDGIEKGKETLLKMLKTLKKSPFKSINTANLKAEKLPLFEIFITLFLEEVSKLLKKGIKSNYIKKEENLKYLKGKLKLSEQIKRNSVHRERFYVEYDEFNTDRVENRLIKSTLNLLYKKTNLNRNKKRIREFLFTFDEVNETKNYKLDLLRIDKSRGMKSYEEVLKWAEIFLLGNSMSSYRGNTLSYALLFNMNRLFEDYIGAYLKKQENLLELRTQDNRYSLVYIGEDHSNGKFKLKPDFVYKEKGIGLVVADTKWKILNDNPKENYGISQSDMYQLYAYGTKYEECQQLYLIYPEFIGKEVLQLPNFNFNENLKLNILFYDFEKNTLTG